MRSIVFYVQHEVTITPGKRGSVMKSDVLMKIGGNIVSILVKAFRSILKKTSEIRPKNGQCTIGSGTNQNAVTISVKYLYLPEATLSKFQYPVENDHFNQ